MICKDLSAIPPLGVKGWVVKWQRALVTPFRDVTALEAETMQMLPPVFTRKKSPANVLNTSKRKKYKHFKLTF